ncbi:MAG: pilus assembly protein TadG-related protein [Pseudomonadota bacterium]
MQEFLKRFHDDTRATIAIVFGLSAIAMFAIVGVAIDSSKIYNAKAQMTSALEASALAAAKLLDADTNASDSAIQDYALAFFNTQVANYQLDDATFGNFRAVINRGDSSVRTLVDVSMGSLFGRVVDGNQTVAFTPDAIVSYKARKIELSLVLDVTGSMAGAKLDSLKTASKNLVDALYASNPEQQAIRVGLVPYSASVNAGNYFEDVSDLDNDDYDRCVVERTGTDALTNARPDAGRYLEISSGSINSRYSCPSSEIVPLTPLHDYATRSAFKNQIDSLTAGGATAGHIGLALGWYMVSPEWSSIWPVSPRGYDPDNVIKAVILMTDGVFNAAYAGGPPVHSSTDPLMPGSSPNHALALCDAMSAGAAASQKILIYTVAFQAPMAAETMLKDCSGESNFFNADNAGDLVDVFKDIAEKLTSLRLTG